MKPIITRVKDVNMQNTVEILQAENDRLRLDNLRNGDIIEYVAMMTDVELPEVEDNAQQEV